MRVLTVGLNALRDTASFTPGRGVGDVQRYSVEHELVLRLQVFTGCNRVAHFCEFNVTVCLRPAIFHRCVDASRLSALFRKKSGWLHTNAEVDHLSGRLERL